MNAKRVAGLVLLVAACAFVGATARIRSVVAQPTQPRLVPLNGTEASAVNGLDMQYQKALESFSADAKPRLVAARLAEPSDQLVFQRRQEDGGVRLYWAVVSTRPRIGPEAVAPVASKE